MNTNDALRVPDSLKAQLLDYRRRVWRIKLIEAVSIALFAMGAAFLIVYGWDRFADTPPVLRVALLLGAIAITGIVPWFVMRWLVRYRNLESLARLLAKKMPSVGDQLLGVIELTHSDSEQARSIKLCQAAMQQVAKDAESRDFGAATPPSSYRVWAILAGVIAVIIAVLAVGYPAASRNALSRLVTPWTTVPRYTFTRIDPINDQVVIAHGEATNFPVQLSHESRWQPPTAELSIGNQATIKASLSEGGYLFAVPPQIQSSSMRLRVGDFVRDVTLKPMLRPELSSIIAHVQLPDYLGRPKVQSVDSRAGRVTLVRGSQAVVTATANGTIDGVIAVQCRAGAEPVTHDSSTVVGSEYHLAPAAGTA